MTQQQCISPKVAGFLAALSAPELAEVDAWMAVNVPPRRVAGWKEIALEIGYHPTVAWRFATRTFDPLPVEYDLVGDGVWAYASALRAWLRRQNVPYALRVAAIAQGRERRRGKTAAARAARAKRRQAGAPSTAP